MPLPQRKLLINAYFFSQFGYCPLVWMNHRRILNDHTSKTAFRLVYSDFCSTFSEFLIKDESVTIHQQNVKTLVHEMFEVKYNLASKIMKNIFSFRPLLYNLRNSKGVLGVSETISFLPPKI